MRLPKDFILHISAKDKITLEAEWQGELVRCQDCRFNYGNEHNCKFDPEDILCTYWESDGLEANDYCSRGKENE